MNRTIKNPKFTNHCQPTRNYEQLTTEYQLTQPQLEFINTICPPNQHKCGNRETQTPEQTTNSSSTRVEDEFVVSDTAPNTTGRINLMYYPYRTRSAVAFIEALLVQWMVKQVTGECILRFTHRQLLDIVRIRHGLEIGDRQFQIVKMRFCSMPRDGWPYHHATQVELIIETLKGTQGIASEYTPAPIFAAVL